MSKILVGPEAIAEGVARLRDAMPVAFPTETVYGLGADALDHDAVQRVFDLKGRPANNPLIVHVSGTQMARSVVRSWTEHADTIARAHWPGPVTLVLDKHESVPDIVCASGDTVAVRCPAHPVALALIDAFGRPIVGPSANPSGWISPTIPEHVCDGFPNDDLIVIDGGPSHAGIESTVIDLTGPRPMILRQGVVGAQTLSDTLGAEVLSPFNQETTRNARSPGLIGPHYQPRRTCRLVDADSLGALEHADVAIITWSIDAHPSGGVHVRLDADASGYAAGLYAAMHQCDAEGISEIWIEIPPTDPAMDDDSSAIWAAVRERLARATKSV